MSKQQTLLERLIHRGDQVAIINGRVTIVPASGKVVEEGWLKKHQTDLAHQIGKLTGIDIYHFTRHTTGRYGAKKSAGVTLHYTHVLTGNMACVTFNADLTRARNSHGHKAGTPLPRGRFYVSSTHAFTKFWRALNLPLPKRLSEFHKCIGKLKGPLITAQLAPENKLDKRTLRVVNVSYETIRDALESTLSSDKSAAMLRQPCDNLATTFVDKVLPENHTGRGLQADSSACTKQRVLRNQEGTGNAPPPTHHKKRKPPEIQTTAEWLADYERPPPEDKGALH